jgi:hypothetical protein
LEVGCEPSPAASLAIKHSKGRVIIGGAGGYQPLDHTPEIWFQVVSKIFNTVKSIHRVDTSALENNQ